MAKSKLSVSVVGNISKVVRSSKSTATITIDIPTADAAKIPIGRVGIEIEPVQSEMKFGGNKHPGYSEPD